MKKILKKVVLSAVIIFFVAVIAFFANAFFGNPISKFMAEKAAQKHLVEAYSGNGFEIEDVSFNFKSTNYNVHVISDKSRDSSFVLTYDMAGNLLADSYDYCITQRGNTALRINFAYRDAVDAILAGDKLSFETHIGFGDIEFVPAEYKNDSSTPSYSITTEELVLDKEYDINEFGKKAGHLTVYAYDDTVSSKRLSQMLLELREEFDKAKVTFYAVDFVLEYPKQDDGTQKDDRVEVMNFLYKDIHEKGLEKRVEESNASALEYYKKQDGEKFGEMSIVQ